MYSKGSNWYSGKDNYFFRYINIIYKVIWDKED